MVVMKDHLNNDRKNMVLLLFWLIARDLFYAQTYKGDGKYYGI